MHALLITSAASAHEPINHIPTTNTSSQTAHSLCSSCCLTCLAHHASSVPPSFTAILGLAALTHFHNTPGILPPHDLRTALLARDGKSGYGNLKHGMPHVFIWNGHPCSWHCHLLPTFHSTSVTPPCQRLSLLALLIPDTALSNNLSVL